MNQEDLIKGIDKLNETFKMDDDNLVLNDYERQRLFKLAYDMQMKINNLQQRIDKAVEYIINHTQSTAHLEMDTKSIKQLLDILRGDE